MLPNLFFILGQTATGKTARAVVLAKELGGELINCDSRQIYKGLSIITGKTDNPTDIPVHMVDIVDPNESYSAYDFAVRGIDIINGIKSRGKIPILIGGTGNYARMLLYIDPLVKRSISSVCHPACPDCFGELVEGSTKQDLQQRLMQLDSVAYDKLTPSDKENPRRLIRAIQRVENDMSKLLDLDSPNALANQYKVEVTILLHKDQEALNARIVRRVEERLRLGAIEECQTLLAHGYKPTDPGLATLGYQSILRHLAGEIDFETMKTEWATKERQYAKRQKTYLLKYFPQATIICV